MTLPAMLLGADFGRSEDDLAEIYYYLGQAAASASVGIVVPRGWRLTGNDPRHAAVEDVVVGKATLAGAEGLIEIGSPVRIVVRPGGADVEDSADPKASAIGQEALTLRITSEALTTWSLAGPIAVADGDALAAFSELDGRYASGDGLADAGWRLHRGLQCSAYVNLTAFLEDVYGPVPSGDYKVYRRIAYASTFVHSAVERTAELCLVGEDRFVVWCNGIECLRTARANAPMRAAVRLRRGWNRLLVKSSQDATREWGGRRWGFELRLSAGGGRLLCFPLPGTSDDLHEPA